ncbi:MAG: S41 family peptidase [Verrucomicrobiota bacterium]
MKRNITSPFLIATLAAAALPLTTIGHAQENDAATNTLDALGQSELQEAFRTLSQHYIDKDALDYESLNKAALEGLLNRLSFGASIVERSPAEEADPETEDALAFHSEIIIPGLAYIRPVTFSLDEIKATRDALKEFKTEEVETLIIDFRAPVPNDEFARVAAFADLFTPAQELLFKIAKPDDERPQSFQSKNPPAWNDDLILLIDAETSPAAETAAAVINHLRPSLIVGEKTPGAAVQYEEIALTPDTALRFASAQVLLPDDSTLFRTGITPRLKSRTPPKAKRNVFLQSQDKGLSRFLFERERPRMNEAALVSGINPELEFYLAKSAGESTRWDKRALHDHALQSVVEFLNTATFLELTEEEPKSD